jgi:hypothetical protein
MIVVEVIGSRVGDDGAGDSDAAAHASGKLGREFVESLLELDEAEGFGGAGSDFFFGKMFFHEAIADVVADGEGVEEGALLEDGADVAAELEEVFFAHGADFFSEDEDTAGVGADEAIGELEQNAFADAGGAKKDAHFAWAHLEGDVFEDRLALEADGDVVEDDDGLSGW